MKTVYKDTIAASLLLYLRDYGDTKRADVSSVFSEHYRQSVNKAVKGLLSGEFIAEYTKPPKPRYRPVRYLSLTEKGLLACRSFQNTEINEVISEIKAIRRDERRERVMQVMTACKSAGIAITDSTRPSLSLLLSPTEPQEDVSKVLATLGTEGAYYSLTELRKESAAIYGDGPLTQSRCIGIIIRGTRVFFVYNMGTSLIYFYNTIETRIKETVLTLLNRSAILKKLIRFDISYSAPCILFGNTYNCIAQLFYDSHKGCVVLDKNGNPIKARDTTVHNKLLSMDVICSIYTEVYFIPSKDSGTSFEFVTTTQPTTVDKMVSKWISLQDGLRPIDSSRTVHAVVKGTGDSVYVWLDYDIKKLYSLFMGNAETFVIVPAHGPERVISKILGTRLINVQTIDGRILQTPRYTDTGYPLKERTFNDN